MQNWELIPPMDVVDEGSQVRFIFSVPGTESSSLQVELDGRWLQVEGKIGETSGNYLHQENPRGFYRRAIPLPPGLNEERPEASFCDGRLQVCFIKDDSGEMSGGENQNVPVTKL